MSNKRDFFNILIGGVLAWMVWDLSEKFFPDEPETLEELVERTQDQLPPNCQAFGIDNVDQLRDIVAVHCEGQGVFSVNAIERDTGGKFILVMPRGQEIQS
jgi:hypothetical protein